MDKVANLIVKDIVQDELGRNQTKRYKKQVYIDLKSIKQEEYFKASTNGFSPDYQANMFAWDYNDETEIEIDGILYDIYRVYKMNDIAELYLKRVLANE